MFNCKNMEIKTFVQFFILNEFNYIEIRKKKFYICRKMHKQSIILSANGLKNVLIDKEEDFVFIIGGSEIKMNHIFAEFISPTVAHVHRSDPTVKKIDLTEHLYESGLSEYEENIIKTLNDEKVLSTILKVSQGEHVEIENEIEKNKLQYFSILVGNDELFNLLETLEYDNKKEMSLEELIFELQFYQRINPRFDLEQYHKKLDYISSRITPKDSKFLINLPTDLLYCILNNEHFKHDNEDIVFDIINEHFSKQNCNYHQYNIYEFYEHLKMNELSLNKFESMISKLNYSEMTQSLWTQLVDIILASKSTNINSQKSNASQFEYDGNPNHRFEGIIHHLQNNKNDNLHDLGIITVTSKTVYGSNYPKYVIDFNSNDYFSSSDDLDWLKYDFKDKKIRPTSYSIKTRHDYDDQNPVNWCIEVSNTGGDNNEEWRIIDSRTGIQSVSKRNQTDTFHIQTQLTDEESYQYVRFRCTGRTSHNCDCLAISSLEYFGTLIE